MTTEADHIPLPGDLPSDGSPAEEGLDSQDENTLEFQRRIQIIVVATFTAVVLFVVAVHLFGPHLDLVDPSWQTLFSWVVIGTTWVNIVVLYLQTVHRMRDVRLVAFPMVVLYCVLIAILVVGDRAAPADRYTVFRLFFFLPILYASLAYELRGALAAAVLVCGFSACAEVIRHPQIIQFRELPTSLIVQTALWLIVGVVTGVLTQEEKRLRRRTVTALTQAHQKMRELSALIDIGRRLNSTLNMRQLLNLVVNLAVNVLQAEAGSMFLVDEETEELVFEVVTGEKAQEIEGRRIPKGQGIVGWTVEHGESVLVADTRKDERWYSGIDKESGFTTRSILCVPLQSREKTIGALQVLNKQNEGQFDENDRRLCSAMAAQVVVALENAQLVERMEEVFLSTVESLATALEFRDTETEGHSRRVRDLTLALARKMDVEPSLLPHIAHGALLHDIGKIAVPDAILRKPGKLSETEWKQMKRHCRLGWEMVRRIQFLSEAGEIVLSHQERYDGTGYPRQLKGREIPLGARLFAVADAFDAMTSDRPYRKAMSFAEARKEIQRCRGLQFDPAVVDAFMRLDDETLLALRSAREGRSQTLTQTAAEVLARTVVQTRAPS